MKLSRLILKNYIGIYNGMGLNQIMIDFSKCTHKIIVIKGDNGSGKSTVYRALTPLNDSSSEFIYDKDAMKVIEYLLDDGSLLTITYTSQAAFDNNTQRWHHKTKCSILRTFPNSVPIELNPSYNVTSGKDIIYDLFQLDDNYLVLSALSSTNKGIGSLRPADRKKYVNAIISSLEEFISMNKMLNKKGSILKSMLTSIVSKLDQIGNIEMAITNLEKDKKTLEILETTKNSLIESIGILTAQISLLNESGAVAELYTAKSKDLAVLKEELQNINPNLVYDDKTMFNSEVELAVLNTKIQQNKEQIDQLLMNEKALRESISKNEHEVELYSAKKPYPSEYYYTKIKEINAQLAEYIEELERIGFSHYKFIDKDQYAIALDSIEFINETIHAIHSNYDSSIISEACTNLLTDEIPQATNEDYIKELKDKAEKMLEVIHKQEVLQEQAKAADQIPKDCSHLKDCPFIQNIINAKLKIMSNFDLYVTEYKALQEQINDLQSDADHCNLMMLCRNEVEKLVSYILQQGTQIPLAKFFNHPVLDNKEDILIHISNADPIHVDTRIYWDKINCLKMIDSLTQEKTVLAEHKIEMDRISMQIDPIKAQIESDKKKLDQILESKSRILSENEQQLKSKFELEALIRSLIEIRDSKEQYKTILDEIGKLEQEVKDLHEKSVKLASLLEEHAKKKDQLNNLTTNDIPLITNRIESYKYQLTMYEQYKKDYNQYLDLYNKLQMVKNYSSINGIQSIYIEAFLNSILKLTNKLLSLLFNGRFVIKEFRVNENEFAIPCIDYDGQERPDISDMSDSQLSMISMIISFVLLHQASGFYNIIKLDEVDGNLDNTNRLQFATLINQILDILNFHQCIIISHNNEIDLGQADMILFRIDKKEELSNLLNSGANVIFSLS